jgi:hypothetical protein
LVIQVAPTQPGLSIQQTRQVRLSQPPRVEVLQPQKGPQVPPPALPSLQPGRPASFSNINPNSQRLWGKSDGGWGAWGVRQANQTNGSYVRGSDRVAPRDLPQSAQRPGRPGMDIRTSRLDNAPRVSAGPDRAPKIEPARPAGPAVRTVVTEKPVQADRLNPPERHDRLDSSAVRDRIDTGAARDQRQAMERRERVERIERIDRVSGLGPKGRRGGGAP